MTLLTVKLADPVLFTLGHVKDFEITPTIFSNYMFVFSF